VPRSFSLLEENGADTGRKGSSGHNETFLDVVDVSRRIVGTSVAVTIGNVLDWDWYNNDFSILQRQSFLHAQRPMFQ
jgi:hypothetical protein